MRQPKIKGLAQRTQKHYGWRPDTPDFRDHVMLAHAGAIPPSVSLRAQMPKPLDQGQLGSCTANAIALALEFDSHKQGHPRSHTPSRLFVYYNERAMEGTVSEDAGAEIRDGVKSVAQVGAPPESLWPYVIAKFADKPSAAAYRSAKKHHAVIYERVTQEVGQLQAVLASGVPFVFGFSVYESFESEQVAADGKVPMPSPGEKLLGGHAVCAIGYKPGFGGKLVFEVQNSWGESWGDDGRFWMPEDYITSAKLASDFWVIRSTT